MKTPVISLTLILITISCSVSVYSQECTVDAEALKGSYTGECKKGKANGTGKAVGTDTYEGEFKSGLPHGEGTYTWSNGDSFTGKFEKGLKQGQGTMTVKREGKPDSTFEGYWKKNEYAGRYEYPYKVFTKTKRVTKVDIKPAMATTMNQNQITIMISSTSAGGGTLNLGNGVMVPKVEIRNLILQAGNYTRSYSNTSHATKSETILYEVAFPIRLRMDLTTGDAVELIINETGSYVIDINLNE